MTATAAHLDAGRAWDALAAVADPEIPPVSVVDLGIIDSVTVESGNVRVRMLPTFVGCPALDVIRNGIVAALKRTGFDRVDVDVVFDPPWTTDRIRPEGLRKLAEFGLALPGPRCAASPESAAAIESNFSQVACPFCGSRNTTLESLFGPTLCRAIHYCNACLQSFEQFKPVG